MSDWFTYLDQKTAPRPSYRRQPPSKEIPPKPAQSYPDAAPIEVTESEASDSMILRAFKFWQR